MPDTEERIEFYHNMYGKILDKVSVDWPKDAVAIAGGILQEISKDFRSEMISQMRRRQYEINKDRNQGYRDDISDDNLATKKQRQTIHKFGVTNIPEDLSKADASDILDELIDLSKHGNKEILKDRVKDLNEQWNEL